jgi:SNF2 family DNA or RNA helicase
MIRPHPRRWDWFEVDKELGRSIAQVPGVVFTRGLFEIHRTHLALLDSLEVQTLLESVSQPLRSHEERAALAADRDLVLRVNQQSGLDFVEPRKGVLVADEPRLGKTLTALLAHDPATGPLVVIAPLSTRAVWLRWMKVLWPDETPVVVTGTKIDVDKLRGKPILFAHYDILIHHQMTSIRPGTLIVDEAHVLSNPKSKRTQAVLFFATAAHRAIFLTGTPLWNTSEGLWAILAGVNPGAWGRPHDFKQRYCQPTLTEYGWRYSGLSHEDEWALRRSEVLIARKWSDVRQDLPPIQRTLELVDLDAADLLKLDQLAFELRINDKTLAVEDLNYYRQATGLYKVPLAVELAEQILASGNHVVLWCWHTKVARAIGKKLAKRYASYVVTGDDSEPARERLLSSWKSETEPSPLVITLACGQVGIDLSHAHHAIVVEIDWTPLVIYQAEMRTFDADRPMAITYVGLNHDVDHALIQTIQEKVSAGAMTGMPAAGADFKIPSDEPHQSEAELLISLGQALSRSGPGGTVPFACTPIR